MAEETHKTVRILKDCVVAGKPMPADPKKKVSVKIADWKVLKSYGFAELFVDKKKTETS